ncbi:MAG: hypothetical protein WA317_11125 [Mycobacterium sp.]|uniref:hypothetical protein n=1 Tax=Mycobacterium sp. TaxID=1785 RepID=UPI003CC5A487
MTPLSPKANPGFITAVIESIPAPALANSPAVNQRSFRPDIPDLPTLGGWLWLRLLWALSNSTAV